MATLRERLDLVRSQVISSSTRESMEPLAESRGSKTWAVPPRYYELATTLGAEILHRPAGSFCRKVVTRHANLFQTVRDEYLFHSFPNIQDRLSTILWPDSAKHSEISFESIAFVDTETTGLGGSGAVPFVVGIGWFCDNAFAVDQYLLPDYADEAAMLEAVREDLARASAVVTYNGASFDIPLLRDRFVLHRIERDFQPANHLDLLHLSRRVFRNRLRDCSLGNLERLVLEFERIDDLPGYLMPSTYFEWLNSERAAPLADVLEHNAEDIISLAALFQFLQRAVLSSADSLSSSDDIFGLSRFFQRRRRDEEENRALKLIHHERPVGERTPEMTLAYARRLKMSGDLAGAKRLWEEIAALSLPVSLDAYRQLAMIAEHRERDFTAALKLASDGLLLVQRLKSDGTPLRPSLETDLLGRRTRLLARLQNSR